MTTFLGTDKSIIRRSEDLKLEICEISFSEIKGTFDEVLKITISVCSNLSFKSLYGTYLMPKSSAIALLFEFVLLQIKIF